MESRHDPREAVIPQQYGSDRRDVQTVIGEGVPAVAAVVTVTGLSPKRMITRGMLVHPEMLSNGNSRKDEGAKRYRAPSAALIISRFIHSCLADTLHSFPNTLATCSGQTPASSVKVALV
jgi:hypothetical protein